MPPPTYSFTDNDVQVANTLANVINVKHLSGWTRKNRLGEHINANKQKDFCKNMLGPAYLKKLHSTSWDHQCEEATR